MSPLVQFSLFLIISHQSSLIHSIKYTLTKSTSETTHHDEDVITSEENVRKLTVEDEFHIFRQGLASDNRENRHLHHEPELRSA
jgi:hypothetical protein